MNKLLTFLSSTAPLINIKELERASGIPDTMINQVLKGTKAMPNSYIPRILNTLIQRIGPIKMGDWIITQDEIGTFLCYKGIPGTYRSEAADARLYDQSEITEFIKSTTL